MTIQEQYEDKFGMKPNKNWKEETIRAKLEGTEPPEKSPETISITKEELKQLLKEAKEEASVQAGQNLTQMNVGGWEEKKDDKGANKRAHMKLYQKDTDSPLGLIIDWKHLRFDYDEKSRDYDKDIYKITVLYDDSTEEVEMSLLDFIKINNYETVEIIETKRKKLIKKEGQVRRTGRNKEGYAMSPHPMGGTDHVIMGDFTDMIVERIEETHIIKRPDGRTLEIPNGRLNP